MAWERASGELSSWNCARAPLSRVALGMMWVLWWEPGLAICNSEVGLSLHTHCAEKCFEQSKLFSTLHVRKKRKRTKTEIRQEDPQLYFNSSIHLHSLSAHLATGEGGILICNLKSPTGKSTSKSFALGVPGVLHLKTLLWARLFNIPKPCVGTAPLCQILG